LVSDPTVPAVACMVYTPATAMLSLLLNIQMLHDISQVREVRCICHRPSQCSGHVQGGFFALQAL
jgi:hypothetical protein